MLRCALFVAFMCMYTHSAYECFYHGVSMGSIETAKGLKQDADVIIKVKN